MVLKSFFDISTGFRFSKISVECSVHLCSCPCMVLPLACLKRYTLQVLRKLSELCDIMAWNLWFLFPLFLSLFKSTTFWKHHSLMENIAIFPVNDQSCISTFIQSWRPNTWKHSASGQIPKPKPNIEIFKNSYPSADLILFCYFLINHVKILTT